MLNGRGWDDAPKGFKQIQEQFVVSGLRYFGLLAITMANMMPGLDMFVLFVIALSITFMKLFDVLSGSRYDLRDTQFVPRILRASKWTIWQVEQG